MKKDFSNLSDSFFYKVQRNMVFNIINEFSIKGDILDVGCNDGKLLTEFEGGNKLYGLDLNDQNLKYNKIVFYKRDITKKINLKRKFDLVICLQVLEYLDDVDQALDNLSNFIKKRGYLIISTINGNSKWIKPNLKYNMDVEPLLKYNKFIILKKKYYGFPLFNLYQKYIHFRFHKLEFGGLLYKLYSTFLFNLFRINTLFFDNQKGIRKFILAQK